MLKMLFLLGLIIAVCVGLGVLLMSIRNRRRRHLSRAHRISDYAERQSQWRTYLSLNKSRSVRRITDQREPD